MEEFGPPISTDQFQVLISGPMSQEVEFHTIYLQILVLLSYLLTWLLIRFRPKLLFRSITRSS